MGPEHTEQPGMESGPPSALMSFTLPILSKLTSCTYLYRILLTIELEAVEVILSLLRYLPNTGKVLPNSYLPTLGSK